MLLALANCTHVASVAAYGYAEDDVTASIAAQPQTSEILAPLPIPKAKKHVYLLLGGIVSSDGWATSAGMFGLRSSLAALPDVEVTTYEWASFKKAANDIASLLPDDIVIVIGYSGGGAMATWLANGQFADGTYMPRPRIDLMVLYDPSPTWSMMSIHDNVKRAICYRNNTPLFFGLGGAALVGKNTSIATVDIFEHHLLVQTDNALHQRTIDEVKNIQGPAMTSFAGAEGSMGP
jgi:pimeloyl-ACP methyl ester carboxylesterase